MRRILILIFISIFLIQQATASNDKDKEYLLLLQQNIKKALINTEHFIANPSKKSFKQILITWKKVEALYILGNISEDYIDFPRYIDVYHSGNENLQKQLDFIIVGNENLENALYKNSFKTINALEYLIYHKETANPRVKKTIQIIGQSIYAYLKKIQQAYLENMDNLIAQEKQSMIWLFNTLSQETYKLKEWRLGEAAGLSSKYYNKPNNARGEYYLSKNSMLAIKTIFQTQKEFFLALNQVDFKILKKTKAIEELILQALILIDKSLEIVENIKNDDFYSNEIKTLYEYSHDLLLIYYDSFTIHLGLTSQILDADGD